METAAKLLIGMGAFLLLLGLFLLVGNRLSWLPLGRLPGDIRIQKGGSSFFFPVVTCIVLSLIGSLILNLLQMRRR